ncbi:MAG: AAA family ATPase, partial [Nitrospiraceae bacterium]|nr:AAA family ATPase [Nitrospiraceae bacterium]
MVGKSEDQSHLLVINTLGRFEILQEGRRVEGLTLRKAQALLVYLCLNPGPHERSRLAGLFWGGCNEKKARHNLRQTLWHLRRALPADLLVMDRRMVELKQAERVQVDVLVFEDGIQRAERWRQRGDEDRAIAHLRNAVALYQGEFLAGLDADDSLEFATWRISYAARVREKALSAFSQITAYLLRRGEYEQALSYARQQLQLEPWWEEGHRLVMTLLALTGQRSAAIAQYETCRRCLVEEVGVEPMPETTALYERLVHWQTSDWTGHAPEAETVQLPFSGRGGEHARLAAWWEQARRGKGRLALIEGEAGVGKTRLVEEMIHYVEMQGATILRGRCYEFGGDIPYQPIAEALRAEIPNLESRIHKLSNVWLAELARLTPELRELFPDLPQPRQVAGQAARQRLFEAVARCLQALTTPAETDEPVPLLLFLDDLHWADLATLDLLHYLVRQLHTAPIWIIGTYRPEEIGPDHLLTRLRQGLSRDHLVNLLALARLSPAAVTEIARAVAGAEAGKRLGAFLYEESEGNPFYLVETVYSLQEQRALGEDVGSQSWREALVLEVAPHSVQDVILQRVERLSRPARRLLTLAAVIGRHFDDALLRGAARQESGVVAESLEEWLARHLVRPQ